MKVPKPSGKRGSWDPTSMWRSPKIGGTYLGVPVINICDIWGSISGLPLSRKFRKTTMWRLPLNPRPSNKYPKKVL